MDRWATVKRIHQAALEREVGQRALFLDVACAGDEALRREVESLLAYQEDAGTFLESPAVEVSARAIGGALTMTLSGRVLSHYQVQSLLGAGGMGEVYLARDPRLDRAVALKILPPDLAFDVDRMQRFTLEAKAASALNHPNVATIHDVGDSDGVRFIVMEYVEGQTLAEKRQRSIVGRRHRRHRSAGGRRAGGRACERHHASRYQASQPDADPARCRPAMGCNVRAARQHGVTAPGVDQDDDR